MPPPAHVTPPPHDLPALIAPAPPARGELVVNVHLAGGASEWRADGVGYGGFAVGLRLWRFVAPYVGVTLGYGAVDQRLLTRVTVGVELGWTFSNRYRPRVFGAFVHQHEESMASVAEQPFGAVLGIGTGIRHRAGAHFGAGFDLRVRNGERLQLWVGPELGAMYLTYSSGPSWYVVGGVTLTGTLRLW